jgi:hypothetical protein
MQRLVAPVLFVLALTGAALAEDLRGFSAIEAEGRFRVEVAQGDNYSVNLTGADVGNVSTRVRGEELRIWQNNQNWLRGGGDMLDAVVRVTSPRLAQVKSTRGAVVAIAERRAETLAAEASTGGVIEIFGQCERLQARASMGGQINAQEFRCDQVNADASMGGAIRAQARQEVAARASMGGQVEITGDPPRRSADTSMGGEVNIQ